MTDTTGTAQLPNPSRTLRLDLLVQLALADEATDMQESHLAFAHLADATELFSAN